MKITKYILLLFILLPFHKSISQENHSVARQWNEQLLNAIRLDFARPTVHARNLFHVSAAMWDAWAVYELDAKGVFFYEKHESIDSEEFKKTAISYAAYRVLTHRFKNSPNAKEVLTNFETLMLELGLDPFNVDTISNSPIAIGNRIGNTIINFGLNDNSNEINDYKNLYYLPINPPLLPILNGNPEILDFNRWQPLTLDFFQDQSGNIIADGTPEFLSPEWGNIDGFALSKKDKEIYVRDGNDFVVYHDPGEPPLLNSDKSEEYKNGFAEVVEWSGLLDPQNNILIDISPNVRGNNSLGSNDGLGYAENPITGEKYESNFVLAGDYYRVLAEFWADGPDSETPPGHWFTITNTISDHPLIEKKINGKGELVSDLEWDVKVYLVLGGAMHDAAISAWSVKGFYDYIRPISAIRYMCDQGQSTNSSLPSYSPNGIPLKSGSIELITMETVQVGNIHQFLAGPANRNVGKIAVNSWRGPSYINNPDTDTAGVGWILCEEWWPYQRPSFVTPPFAGYVSGHSTFSRAAAEVLTLFTGSKFFPGGLGEFEAPKDNFLVFEKGPSRDVLLQWATYQDAADECSLSRIYGGIHPRADDIPGRLMGYKIGRNAYNKATQYYYGGRPQIIPLGGLLFKIIVFTICWWLAICSLRSKNKLF